ncbi:HD domain-containing protein [Halanaerobacter jeridensis]|uniref:Poly(A) polymerase n=1 Tax=Halanaerobacter jeridensis TaxID=706427 RepID=A0A938XNQ2_9FIRM|nr:HD domain-containing protein [Halanaerobacter jeridensis]MBM7556138.1 poly(A) polymerase [Halanaerobacter jeridensis]
MKLKEIKNQMTDLAGTIYLVGGVIRDYLLEEELKDIDLVVAGPTKEVAQKFAARMDGSFVVLDEQRSMYRVVTADLIYDFSPLRGETIIDDLSRRDFTINAIALKLDDAVFPEQNWIDPWDGLEDLEQGSLRVVNKSSFTDDPLRILRMIRFKAQFNFEITEMTEDLALEASSKITEVANERINTELQLICSYSNAAESINHLQNIGIMSTLIPQIEELQEIGACEYHQEDVWTHSLAAIKEVENMLSKGYWINKINKDNIPLLKIAVLLHDYGKLFTKEKIDGKIHFYGHEKVGAKRLRSLLKELTFSNQEINYIFKLVRYHMRPFSLYQADNLTFKGKYRFFKIGADVVEDISLVAAADKSSTAKLNNRTQEMAGFLEFLRQLIADKEKFIEQSKEQLINGNDLIEELNLAEGPKIGEVLAEIEKLQAQGEITTRAEALKVAQNYID